MPRVEKETMVGTQLLIPRKIKERAEALAARRGSSVAEVWRTLIERGLPALERQYPADQE